MDKPLVAITYRLANGRQICVEVSTEVKELLEQSDRQIRSQRRQDRRYLVSMGCIDGLDDTAMTAPHEDIADLIIRMDSYQQLYVAMEKLSEVHRRRVYLYHFCDLTCREIARVENVHHTTVSRSLRQALEVLKGYITE
jgi:DNA-directed RNA polymerase specialized sigma24 family protein